MLLSLGGRKCGKEKSSAAEGTAFSSVDLLRA